MSKGKLSNTEDFINLSVSVHGNKYGYGNVDYKGSKTKVTLNCPEHGDFLITPCHHIHRKQGCPECGKIKRSAGKSKNLIMKKFEGLQQPVEYKLVPTTKGNFAKVDNEDFDRVKGICWRQHNGYAHNYTIGSMHRFIVNCPDELFVDHINHDRLDNRRSNLRLATHKQNTYNKKPMVGATSRFLGVCWDKSKNKWLAQIGFNNDNIYLGLFSVEEEAARAYDKKALELFGEFANLNFK